MPHLTGSAVSIMLCSHDQCFCATSDRLCSLCYAVHMSNVSVPHLTGSEVCVMLCSHEQCFCATSDRLCSLCYAVHMSNVSVPHLTGSEVCVMLCSHEQCFCVTSDRLCSLCFALFWCHIQHTLCCPCSGKASAQAYIYHCCSQNIPCMQTSGFLKMQLIFVCWYKSTFYYLA